MASLDTHPKAHEAQISALRSMSPSRRASLAISMSEDVRRIALGGIRQRHPDYSDRDAQLALYRLLLEGTSSFVRRGPPSRSFTRERGRVGLDDLRVVRAGLVNQPFVGVFRNDAPVDGTELQIFQTLRLSP